MRRLLLYLLPPLLLLIAWGWARFAIVERRTAELADLHTQHVVAHAGWSYPAHVYSAPAPMDEPFERLVLQALGRNYTPSCPAAEPGQFCERSGEFHLRGGVFPEGRQPPVRLAVERPKGRTAPREPTPALRKPKTPPAPDLPPAPLVEVGANPPGWSRPAAFEPLFMGLLLGEETEWREHLPLEEAPEILLKAVMAAEDAKFARHRGVDFLALTRALTRNTEAQAYAQGGSTLTMQVFRGFSRNKRRTMSRKLNEISGALALERHMGKQAILSAYMDIPYLGQRGSISVCGFRTAAWHYFGVPVEKLSLAQAATLAGILPAPGKFSPTASPALAKERRDRVLRAMRVQGWATAEDVEAALNSPIETHEGPFPESRFPAYLAAVHQWLGKNLPRYVVYGAGLQVFTGLDVAAQVAADKAVEEGLASLVPMLPRYPGQPLQCAVVGIEPSTGRVRTLYGGKGSTPTGFNRATQARRQAGSAYKPLVFAAAFSQRDASGQPRYTPADAFINTLRDFKTPTGVWRPRNVCSEYTPTACLAYALVWSQNIATATLLEQLGIDPFLDFVQAIGLDTSGYPHELGLALGQAEVTAEEMARFAAMLANGGLRVDFHPVEIALDAAGRLRFERPEPGPRVMREVDAALLRILMQQVVAMGTGGRVRGAGAHPGYAGEIFGKTGTTDDEKDLWFVGGTPNLAGALWLGYDEPLRIGATGADLTAPMFGWWQRAAHVGLPQPPFKKYDEIEIRPVCNLSGKRPGPRCLVTQTPLLKGTGPREACTLPHEEILDPADFEGMPEVEGAYVPATPSGRRPGLPPEAALGSKKYHTIWNRGEEKAGAPEPGGTTPDGLP